MDWMTIIGVIIGGLFTLAGGYLQASLAAKKQKDDNKNNMKLNILSGVMANRAALSSPNSEEDEERIKESEERIKEYKKPFFSALNQIPLVFNDNEDIVDKFEEFHDAINSHKSAGSDIEELLYKLIKSMYEDLKMTPPAREHFKTIMY